MVNSNTNKNAMRPLPTPPPPLHTSNQLKSNSIRFFCLSVSLFPQRIIVCVCAQMNSQIGVVYICNVYIIQYRFIITSIVLIYCNRIIIVIMLCICNQSYGCFHLLCDRFSCWRAISLFSSLVDFSLSFICFEQQYQNQIQL